MLNTRKQRSHLYADTFLKWSVDKRVQTLEKQAIELSLASHEFLVSPCESTYLKLCEKVSDAETITEVCEDSFPSMRANIDIMKKEKLVSLKKRPAPEPVAEDKKPAVVKGEFPANEFYKFFNLFSVTHARSKLSV